MATISLIIVFIPSFYNASRDIAIAYIYNKAREQYILSEKSKGNLNINVLTPVPVSSTHSAFYGGIDVLYDPASKEYAPHNSAKALWYGIRTLSGTPTFKRAPLRISIRNFLQQRESAELGINDLYLLIYENWSKQ